MEVFWMIISGLLDTTQQLHGSSCCRWILQCVWFSWTFAFSILSSCPSLCYWITSFQMCLCNDIPSIDLSILLANFPESYNGKGYHCLAYSNKNQEEADADTFMTNKADTGQAHTATVAIAGNPVRVWWHSFVVPLPKFFPWEWNCVYYGKFVNIFIILGLQFFSYERQRDTHTSIYIYLELKRIYI